MYNKSHIQNWINLGVPSLISSRTFLNDLSRYVQELGDPSLIAMTGGQAQAVMDFITETRAVQYSKLYDSMKERVRISKLQGGYSLERKRLLNQQRSQRMNTV